jgi:hypothetical protein
MRRFEMNVKKLQLLLALTLGLLTVAGALMLLGTWSSGLPIALAQSGTGVIRVAPSGTDTPGCGGEDDPCETIQYAVDQAVGGDEIHIATFDVSGTVVPLSIVTTTARYTGTGTNVVALTKSLTLRGGYIYVHTTLPPVNTWTPGPIPATVDGEGARRALYVSGNVTPTLRLFAFINGNADRGGNVYAEDAHVRFVATPILTGNATYGGGLYLKNCRITFDPGDLDWQNLPGFSGLLLIRNNTAAYGGGIYVEEGAPVLAGLAVYSNTATADGGGLYLQGGRPVVAGGLVLENQAGNRGGGLYLADSVARIAGTAVYSNIAADGAGFYLDGPFAFSEQTIPVIANSYVRHNRTTGSQGGGFYFRQAIAGLVNNVIADNHATDGAAMYLWASSPQLFHNTIAQNDGNSGIYLTDKPGQIWPPVVPIPSYPSFTNTILVSHTTGLYVASTGLGGILENQATLEGTLWWGNGNDTGGPGPVVHTTDVYSDPLFVCTGNFPDCLRPYHILTDSAAVDAGVVVALTIPGSDLFVDIDLQLRPSGEGYDIGADEVVSETYSVWLIPPLSTLAVAPGQTVTHAHLLMNTGLETDTYDLETHSSSGWAALLADTVITLSAQTSATVQVRVSAPPAATNGMSDTTAITATSHADPDRQARAWDVTGVFTGDVADVSVGKWADTDLIGPGGAVRFTIVVTKSGSLTGTLAVTLTDTLVPTQALTAWRLPANCTGNETTGLITCTWNLPGDSPLVTRTFTIAITTTTVYTGLLVNTAEVGAAALDPDPANNVAQATVGVTSGWRVYLPLVMRNFAP